MTVNKNYLSENGAFVFVRTYARWIDAEKRRETWPEAVKRYAEFLRRHVAKKCQGSPWIKEIEAAILRLDVMPSMRALWSAGESAESNNVMIYNCSAVAVDCVDAFSEALYLLSCGVGVGYSVLNKHIAKLPKIHKRGYKSVGIHSIPDTREGWADSVKHLLLALYDGVNIEFDYGAIRPAGTRLKKTGGRASGHEPLKKLHEFIKEVFDAAQGRKLTSLEASDIMNVIAECIIVGGVRRSAQIALSDLNDEEMRTSKKFPFPPRRSMANVSSSYPHKPSPSQFMIEIASIIESESGERGIFNLHAHKNKAPDRRNKELIAMTNPCGEISLRENGLCNLSEVVVRQEDTIETLLAKVEIATWIGVIQSTMTDFHYIRDIWRKNCEEERLIGVSLTGQMDNAGLLTAETLALLKEKVLGTARIMADTLSINMPAACTTVKPSGTCSELVGSSAGMHPRYAEHYMRRYRISAHDKLIPLLRAQGIPLIPDAGSENLEPNLVPVWVIEFPCKSPSGSTFRKHLTAIQQLEHYKSLMTHYVEHNASVTIYVKECEWVDVASWVYANWDIVKGVSFLPYDGGKYKLAPYEEITKAEYESRMSAMKSIDYSMLSKYEQEDNTKGELEYACTGKDSCTLL